jgi:RimJ/RimL family protein N-acetyltransferase
VGDAILETERLRLEPLIEAHAAELVVLYSDPRMYEFIPQDPPSSLEALALRFRLLEARQSPDGKEGWFNWAMRSKSLGVCVGCVQVTLRQDGRAQLAYDVGVPYWRQGYATEACRRVIGALFTTGVTEIRAELDTRNEASIRLLEKLGFRRGDLKRKADFFKGSSSDEWTYTLRSPQPPLNEA